VLIKTLREKYGAKGIFLWGRSMGAATAILYAAKYDDLLGVVADNAFSDL
jgi:pimeloyl-ACP methyl ester carboxylesterase